MTNQKQSFCSNGIRFRLEVDGIWPFKLMDSFQSFRCKNTTADIRWIFKRIDTCELTLPPLNQEDRFQLTKTCLSGIDSPLLRASRVRDRLDECLKDPEKLALELRPDAVTIIDFSCCQANLFYTSDQQGNMEEFGIGPTLLASFLPHFDACLLHASAVVRNDKTAVFLAADEGGKTTAARLAPSGTILSDDQVLVRRFLEGSRVSGTPWGLHVDGKLQAPLSGLFLLKKAHHFALAPFATRELVAHIWEEVKNLFFILPKPLKKKAFAVVCAIAASVPAWKMSFTKDYINWEAIDQAMAG